jgi:uncharacterized protein
MEINQNERAYLYKAGLALLVILALYFGIKTIAEIKSYRFIGGGATATNTISFNGVGEVSALPNLATFNLTIRESGVTTKEAQDKATAKEKAVIDFLDKLGVDKKDVKTENYNVYPKYDYGTPCYGYGPCRPQEAKIVGYEVSENVSVQVRDLEKVGEVVQGAGTLKVAEISGPNYSIEKEDALKAEARRIAIEDAKNKAEALSRDLGVHLIRIVSFSENVNYPMPYYAKNLAMDMVSEGAAQAPALPTGENKITSNVTITYEIR